MCRAQASSLSVHNGDAYGGYNKPEAVREWLDHVEPDSDYVLILDTDLIIREPFLPKQLHVRPGFARSAEFGYMKGAPAILPGVSQPLLTAPCRRGSGLNGTHCPERATRESTLIVPAAMHMLPRANQVKGG